MKPPRGMLSTTRHAEQQIAEHNDALQKILADAASQRDEQLAAHRESLSAAANGVQQQSEAALAAARDKWRADLGVEIEAAQARWNAAVEAAFTAGHERAGASLTEHANALLSAYHQEADHHTINLRAAAADLTEKSTSQMEALRASLQAPTEHAEAATSKATETAEKLEQHSARLETVQQHALTNFQTQADDVLNLHRNELHRHSETLLGEVNGRIRGAFDEASREAVERFREQIESLVQPQLSQANEAMQRLNGGRSLLDAALTLHQDRIRESTDASFAEALQQFRSNLGSVEDILRVTTEGVTMRGMSDFELRVESLKQQTVDDLAKSAEWYEKKAQTQTQTAAEKAGEQAARQLREQAGEITNEFAGELDQSSRNFVAYAQTQIADVVSEAFDRSRALFAEAAETTTAAFIDEIQRHARQDLDGFTAELHRSREETRSLIDSAHSELAQKVTVEQESFLRRFQDSLHGTIEARVAEANERVQAGFLPMIESWQAMTNAQKDDLHNVYARMGEQAATQYRDKLDNVSNQWMLATVTSFDHQSRDSVSRISTSAEEKLRETFTKVFADMGDALRDRMQQIAANLTFQSPTDPPSRHIQQRRERSDRRCQRHFSNRAIATRNQPRLISAAAWPTPCSRDRSPDRGVWTQHHQSPIRESPTRMPGAAPSRPNLPERKHSSPHFRISLT